MIDWKKAVGRLEMQEAQLGAFEWLLPKVLSKEGRISLDVAVRPGLKLGGALRISGASTRPLGSFGVIRDISAQMEFEERVLDLKGISASIG